MSKGLSAALFVICCSPIVSGQSTQGLIAGRFVDGVTGVPVPGAEIACTSEALGFALTARTDRNGHYSLPQLSPGRYRLRASAENYQPQELYNVDLPVAGRLEVDFRLRPSSDVWESGQHRSVFLPGSSAVVTFYGPDIDAGRFALVNPMHPVAGALETAVSQVVDGRQILDLPLAGRDVYTMLTTQPGVAADTTTARSLGLSANGQRPSASNFLLDGIEANNYLVTGPLSPVAPEAIQEYRISTNNFSAEYGRASGYIANAVSRAGTAAWHGIGGVYLKNEALNANDFRSNLLALPRNRTRQVDAVVSAGGPIHRPDLYLSASYDMLRSRNHASPRNFRLPTQLLAASAAPDSPARRLLTEFPSPVTAATGLTAIYRVAPPVSVDRSTGLARADRVWSNGAWRLMGRFAGTATSRPDFQWTPYEDFVSGIDENTRGVALGLTGSLRPALVSETRFGWTRSSLDLDRPHREIPLLTSADVTTLPGSPVASLFAHNVRAFEALENLTWSRGRYMLAAGGGVLFRRITGILTAGEDGQYGFASAADFAANRPNLFRVPLDRHALPAFRIPRFDRQYGVREFFSFAQNTFRLTRNLVLNAGIRYDSFGAPRNSGEVQDAVVELGSSGSLPERLAAARWRRQAEDETLYSPDRNDFGLRAGFSWGVSRRLWTVLRGSYGVFYDRLFDNAWQNVRNNNFVLPTAFPITSAQFDFLAPVASVVPLFEGQPVLTQFSEPFTQSARAPTTMFQPGFRTPYSQSWFFGVQQPVAAAFAVEAYYQASAGRKLITNDIVNRTSSRGVGPVFYRGNQGSSSYHGLSTSARYRRDSIHVQAAYTWSHAIDNQSDVLRGDWFNLNPTRLTTSAVGPGFSTFTREFDSGIDRGNADFDQRHNAVFTAVVDLPRSRRGILGHLFGNWRISHLAAFRSGAPFTVYASAPAASGILNQRADLVNPAVLDAGGEVAGGRRLLNPAAFAAPPATRVGNTGRNAFAAPGFYNIDLSISRIFPFAALGESGRLTFRADAFNFLNHANAGIPDTLIGAPTFGVSRYGRVAGDSALPVLSPVNDTSRQVQLILRIEF